MDNIIRTTPQPGLPVNVPGHKLNVDEQIETIEYKLLCRAVLDACRELRVGSSETGRLHLVEGLTRASEYADSGIHWADALADEYRRALCQFDQLANPSVEHARALERVREATRLREVDGEGEC